jgi:hypothetical protein
MHDEATNVDSSLVRYLFALHYRCEAGKPIHDINGESISQYLQENLIR